MGKVWTSPVFNLSVSAMYQLCGEPVAVDLVNNKTVCGNIFTFDPTSYSVVIIIFACNAEPKTIKVITGKSIKDLRKFDDGQLPDGCIKKTPDLECWLGKLLRGAPQSSKEQVSERRKRLIEWLEQNQIRVTSNSDGSITLFDAVRIVAPFTAENCFCDNAVILSRMKRLISKVPEMNSLSRN
ncbi:Gem-associated protein [Dirofilaria immitis]